MNGVHRVKPPNPFDPAQNPNYGPRLAFEKRASDADVLNSVKAFILRFVALSESQACVVAAWVMHTHTIEAADSTPYLAITSAEKQCGKSRLLEVLELLVDIPWKTDKATVAVLPRKIHKVGPTLLLDESDAAFAGEKEYSEMLRGVLNSGHRRGGKTTCCEGPPGNITFQDFDTFCAKAIAGIGKLPDTIADRSISIRLKRAARGERIERFRRRDVEPEAAQLKSEIEAWATAILPGLRDARPDLPEELTDRQQDSAEPLLAIADCAGGDWPGTLRLALVTLCREAQMDDDSIGVQLLMDIRNLFNAGEVERISSVDLVASLCEVETSPWADWSKGKPLSASKMARLLHPFEVSPAVVRIGEKTTRGYTRESFQDAWERYLPPPVPLGGVKSVTKSQSFSFNEIEPKKALQPENVTLSKVLQPESVTAQNPMEPAPDAACDTVTLLTPPTGAEAGFLLKAEAEEGEL